VRKASIIFAPQTATFARLDNGSEERRKGERIRLDKHIDFNDSSRFAFAGSAAAEGTAARFSIRKTFDGAAPYPCLRRPSKKGGGGPQGGLGLCGQEGGGRGSYS